MRIRHWQQPLSFRYKTRPNICGLLKFVLAAATFNLWGQATHEDNEWPKATPETVAIDSAALKSLDQDFANGKYPDTDGCVPEQGAY